MNHVHEFESVYHPTPSAEVRSLGIKAAEIRKCKTCHKEVPFVLTQQGWIQLFEDKEPDERDILFA
jgi:hypothetical protein